MALLISELNPIENEWAELKRRSASMDLGNQYGGMVSDLVRCSPNQVL